MNFVHSAVYYRGSPCHGNHYCDPTGSEPDCAQFRSTSRYCYEGDVWQRTDYRDTCRYSSLAGRCETGVYANRCYDDSDDDDDFTKIQDCAYGCENGACTAPVTHTLTVTKSGTGTVTSNPSGINCGSDCSESYTSGTSVTLTASAATGSSFTGWSGACSGATCTVSMTEARSVTATFCTLNTWYKDADGDGYYPSSGLRVQCSSPGADWSTTVKQSGDCNDNNAAINPGATEVCNGVDDDCDGTKDDGITRSVGCTNGLGVCQRSGTRVDTCVVGGTGTWTLGSCNAIPGTPETEICDGLDNNCDGSIDNGVTQQVCTSVTGCCRLVRGFAGTPCDANWNCHNDCPGSSCWGCPSPYSIGPGPVGYYPDYGGCYTETTCSNVPITCSVDNDGDGVFAQNDCNDNDSCVSVEQTWLKDTDGDLYSPYSTTSCSRPEPPAGQIENFYVNSTTKLHTTNPTCVSTYYRPIVAFADCNDYDANVYRLSTWYLDSDNDRYCDQTQNACSRPGDHWYVNTSEQSNILIPANRSAWSKSILGCSDCDDTNSCVWRNNILYEDRDDDFYYPASANTCRSPEPFEYLNHTAPVSSYNSSCFNTRNFLGSNDCDDTNVLINPGMIEEDFDRCTNGYDDDCTDGNTPIQYGGSFRKADHQDKKCQINCDASYTEWLRFSNSTLLHSRVGEVGDYRFYYPLCLRSTPGISNSCGSGSLEVLRKVSGNKVSFAFDATTSPFGDYFCLNGAPFCNITAGNTCSPGLSKIATLSNETNAFLTHPTGGDYEEFTWSFVTKADYEKGKSNRVEYVSSVIRLDPTVSTTDPYLWVANSGEATVSKVNTRNNSALARYRTGSAGSSPSRTAVDSEGYVYVGNRFGDGTLVKIAPSVDKCIDKNGNGKIETSTNHSDELALGADECVIWRVRNWTAHDAAVRSLSIDLKGNIWAGIYSESRYYVLRPNGTVVGSVPSTQPYGSVIDSRGYLYSVRTSTGYVDIINTNTLNYVTSHLTGATFVYGIAIDASDQVYTVSYASGSPVYKLYFDGSSVTQTSIGGGSASGYRGVTLDSNGNIWTANSASDEVFKYNSSGSKVCQFDDYGGIKIGHPVGIVRDHDGYIWTLDFAFGAAVKIDPDTCNILLSIGVGKKPYTYSDATGTMLAQFIKDGYWEYTLMLNESMISGEISWTGHDVSAGNSVELSLDGVKLHTQTSSGEQSVDLGSMSSGNKVIKFVLKRTDINQTPPAIGNIQIKTRAAREYFSLCCNQDSVGVQFVNDASLEKYACSVISDGFCPENYEDEFGNRISCARYSDPDCGYDQRFYRSPFATRFARLSFADKNYVLNTDNNNSARISIFNETDATGFGVGTYTYDMRITSDIDATHSVSQIRFSYAQAAPSIYFDSAPVVLCSPTPTPDCYTWDQNTFTLTVHHTLSDHGLRVVFPYRYVSSGFIVLLLFLGLLPIIVVLRGKEMLHFVQGSMAKKLSEDISRLSAHIKKQKKAGKSHEHIHAELAEAGWKRHLVELALQGLNPGSASQVKVIAYIRDCQKQRIKNSEIYVALLSAGFSREEIDEVFKKV